MNTESVDEVVQRVLDGRPNSLDVLREAFCQAPKYVRDRVVDDACVLYNDAIEKNYFSGIEDVDAQKEAQQEYAFRTAVRENYRRLGWDEDGNKML